MVFQSRLMVHCCAAYVFPCHKESPISSADSSFGKGGVGLENLLIISQFVEYIKLLPSIEFCSSI